MLRPEAPEATIVAAWKKWYGEAVRSASRLTNVAPTIALRDELNRLASEFDPPKAAGSFFSLPLSLGLMGNVAQTSAAYADIFSCGVDQKLPNPIPRRPDTLILAGDGRLFSPCFGLHTHEDREAREIVLLREPCGRRCPKSDGERHRPWRASRSS